MMVSDEIKNNMDESIQILVKCDKFFKELFFNELNGKPWKFVHQLIGNICIFSLTQVCHQLFEDNFEATQEFLDEISKHAKNEFLKHINNNIH